MKITLDQPGTHRVAKLMAQYGISKEGAQKLKRGETLELSDHTDNDAAVTNNTESEPDGK